MTPIQRILAALQQRNGDPRRTPSGWLARCPAHDDQRPSLSISEGEGGRVLVKCHAGCTVENVCNALGLRLPDLTPSATINLRTHLERRRPRVVAEYDYCDEAGTLQFQVVRFEPKDFRQRRPTPNGMEWSITGVRQVPYRLPEIVAAESKTIVIVEGEKDADNLAAIDVLATCNAGGAGKWKAEFALFFRGWTVIIMPDNDDPGRRHAQNVAASLKDIAASIRIVELAGLPPKGDVSDWITAGGTKAKLVRLADDTPEWSPVIPGQQWPSVHSLDEVDLRCSCFDGQGYS